MNISFLASGTAMVMSLFFINAHNSPLDELGCHRDPAGSPYHCHTGALKGKEFTNKDEAQRAIASVSAEGASESDFAVTYEDGPQMLPASPSPNLEPMKDAALPPPPEAPPKAVINEKLLKVVSWNVRKREKIDYDRIVNVLAEGDIAALQGLDLDEKGKGPLHIIGDLLQNRINDKVCRMWFKTSSNGRESYGILWRNSTVGYVNPSGDIKENCGEMAVVVPITQGKNQRAVAASMFFSKVQKKMFQLGTIWLEKRPGNAKSEIPKLMKPLSSSSYPTIVVGDMKFPTTDIKKWDFKSAIGKAPINAKKDRGSKAITGNIWTRNAVVVRGLHLNLYDRFAEMAVKDIESTVSTSFPMLAEVALTKDADSQIEEMVIKSRKADAKAAKAAAKKDKPKSVEASSQDSFEDPSENLEDEAIQADGDERNPASKKKPKKKTKKTKR
jgi:hypothetical protein